ncbi:MAG: MoxR family ATPase [Dehalococcoidia bacterium]|nr:MoxR family ATPase [Dehalococcoidia bacterium]MCB9491397.1 MoxR family ATPase [Dehalococcoidia bacterium]
MAQAAESADSFEAPSAVQQHREVDAIRAEVARVIVGQHALVDRLLIALLTNNHALIEGVPGLAKTLTVSTLARALQCSFARIQFTPDLLPADVTGTLIFSPQDGQFHVRRGPVFANVVLADEINRAPAKVQSALLEAMQERTVSIGGETLNLPSPFLVLATQNPIEQEGTYPLPEAQLDRFMMKIVVRYPERDEERAILAQALDGDGDQPRAVISIGEIEQLREAVKRVDLNERLREYIVRLVEASREPQRHRLDDLSPFIEFGASPRAAVFLARAAQAYAFIAGRDYVTPEDVKAIAPDVLRHRLVLTYEAEAQGMSADQVVTRLLEGVGIP